MARTAKTDVMKAAANLPANLEEEMSREVAALQKRIAAPSGDRIICNKDKTFSLPNGDTGEELDAIVVDFSAANYYYSTGYNENNITPPDCFAIGLEPETLIPSDNSPDKQCDSCAACWANKFKTGANGRGKACGNTYLLALLPPNADAETPLMVLKVSSTALKHWDAHVRGVARKYDKPVRVVRTKITFDQNTDYQSVRFAEEAPCTKEQILMAQSRLPEAQQRLMAEPNLQVDEVVAAPRRKLAGRKPAPAPAKANGKRKA